MKATGFVAAGGSSSRMGRDKALLPWGGRTLLDHALARLREVCTDVFILCGPERRYESHGAPVVPDLVTGAGPLGGLVTALETAPSALAVLLAVDMPFVTPALLQYLLEQAGAFEAVVPVAAGGEQPLCAVYRRTCAAPARRRVSEGQFKMTSFWPDVRIRRVPESELARFGDPGALLRNLNDIKDYELAVAQGG